MPREPATAGGEDSHSACHPIRVKIRLWRQVELQSVRAVYDTGAVERWGALFRSDSYWQWLVGRNAHSELIVAVEGAGESEEFEFDSRIVGYAVARGSQILELCTLPGYTRVGPRLLARACQDAIEHDYHTISLHTPADDPLHELMVTAGGTWCADGGAGGKLLVKLLDPPRWIEAMYPVLRKRAQAARIRRPCEIVFDVGGLQRRLVITRRSGRLVDGESGQSDVCCDESTFLNLLLGNLKLERADGEHDDVQLQIDDGEMRRRVAALFPAALFWQSQFDAGRF